MKRSPLALPEVLLLEPEVFSDARGSFLETYHAERYREAGLPDLSAQDNLSRSSRGVLRGLHLQNPRPQAKLCQVLEGMIWDVVVDVRVGSPRFGQWAGVELRADRPTQLYVPAGFAHGFCVLSDGALFAYKCSDVYQPDAELVIRWNDPDLAIDWPLDAPIVSPRDAAAPSLREIPKERLVRYEDDTP